MSHNNHPPSQWRSGQNSDETPNVPRKRSAREIMSKIHFKKNPPKPKPDPIPTLAPPAPSGSNPTGRFIHPLPPRPQPYGSVYLPQPSSSTPSIPIPYINPSIKNPIDNSRAQGPNSIPRNSQSNLQPNPTAISHPRRNALAPPSAVSRSQRNAVATPSASNSQRRNTNTQSNQPRQGSSSGRRARRTDPKSDDKSSDERPAKRRKNKEIQNIARSYRCV
ncbi:hypothetical protein DFH28DRAFT_1106581 [Melampsora americana]|nr:hypothetical protein DFH28DRAFT_1106581 [Melampsora americana]